MNPPYTEQNFRRASNNLLRAPPATWNRSDDDMNDRARMIPENMPHTPASVLIPVISRVTGLSVLFTQRAAHLSKHAGQVAFPGGRCDDGEDALSAALRETAEETGLRREFIEPLGFLDGYLTITAFMVTPVVALVREGFTLQPHAEEVAEIFEVPLAFLLNPNNRLEEQRQFKGHNRRYYNYIWQGRSIWGATAGMIKNLQERLGGQE